MTTESDWVAELTALRSDPGPTRHFAIRWFARHEPRLRYPLIAYLSKTLRDSEQQTQRYDVAFYEPDPKPRTRPIAVVTVPATTRFPLSSKLTVEVGGRVEPGGAVWFRLPNGEAVFGTTPVVPPSPFRRMRW